MISEGDNISGIQSFCKGLGLDTKSYSSPVHIGEDKLTIRYRRKNYYFGFHESKIHGTTWFNTEEK